MHRLALAILLVVASPALADGYRRVADREAFLALVEGRALTQFGIRLSVSPGGAIEGRAFGMKVSGVWRWRDDLFCRELAFGRTRLGENCQIVRVRGETLRFIADEGRGATADLRLE